MRISFCGLVLLAICTARVVGENADSCSVSENDEEEISVIFWKSLFTKMNTILRETSTLAETQKNLTMILGELKEKQETQERKLSEFMENTEKLLTKLEERQLLQTSDLSEFINSTQENFKGMQQEFAKHQSNLSYFMEQYLDNNGEWTTILRRQDGSVNFFRNWTEYQSGFGDVNGEFFIGLEKLHNLTTKGAPQELLVVVKDNENEKRTAKYDLFRIGNETQKYSILEVGSYHGDAGDALADHKGMKFTTFDEDNDTYEEGNCATGYHGAWWFYLCYNSHLFGAYKPEESRGIGWNAWRGKDSSMKFAEMKIRTKISKP